MGKDRKKYIDLAMVSLTGLVPLLWFRDGYNALAGFDFSVYLSPVDTLSKSLYLWSGLMAGGYDTSHEVSSLPYYLFLSLPVFAGASLYTAEKIVFAAIFALQGFSIYYMLWVMFEKRKERRGIALCGVVFYSFNYTVMAHFGRGNLMTLLAYGLIPVLFGLLYRGFSDEGKGWRYVVYIALLSFPIAAVKGHPADFLVLVAVALFFTVFHAITSAGKKAVHIALFSLKAAAAAALVNVWWIVPNIMYMRDFGLSTGDLVKEGFYDLGIVAYYSRGASILNIFRNERLDLWFNQPGDLVLNAGIYQTPVFIALGLGLAVLAYTAVVISSRDKNIVFFALLGVISVFFSKGSHEPYGRVYEWLYMNLPGFFLFRAPYRIFSSLCTFATVPLMAYTVGRVTGLVSNDKGATALNGALRKSAAYMSLTVTGLKNIAIGVALALVMFSSCAYAWPLFTGAHLKEKGTLREPGVFHTIPAGYGEARQWLRGQGDGFKVYYPYEVYDANTKWGYNGPDPSFELLPSPKVAARPNGTVYIRYQKPIESLNRTVREWSYGDLKKVLGVYNARYVLLHDDFNRWVLPSDDFNEYMTALLRANGFELRKKAGPLRFFENSGYQPHVNAASRAYLLSGDEASFPGLSLAGLLDEPFLIMARDAGGIDGAGSLIARSGAAQGIIYYNTNVNDLVCELARISFSPSPKGGGLSVNAPFAGKYVVFVKPGAADPLRIDGMPVVANGGTEDENGIQWKMAGEIALAPGRHALRVGPEDKISEVDRTTLNDVGARTVVVPKGIYSAAKGRILERMKDKGFEVVYLLDGSLQDKNLIDLPGEESYDLMLSAPDRYARERVEPTDAGGWQAHHKSGSGGLKLEANTLVVRTIAGKPAAERVRLTRDFTNTELGRYKELSIRRGVYPPASLTERLTVKAYVTLDGRAFYREPLVIVDKDISSERLSIDLFEAARKKYGEAAVYTLDKIEVDVELKEKKALNHAAAIYELTPPVLTGEAGAVSRPCVTGRDAYLKAGEKNFFIDPKNACGWTKYVSALTPGDAKVSFEGAPARQKGLVAVISKDSSPREARKNAEIRYERINPAKYEIMPGAVNRLIVFNDSYNAGWSLKAGGKSYRPIKVNGYANGFVLDNAIKDTAVIEYRPQRAYRLAALFSAVSFAGLVIAGIKRG